MKTPAIVTDCDIPAINPIDDPVECMIETIHFAMTNGWLPSIDHYRTYRYCCTHSMADDEFIFEDLKETTDAAIEWING